MKTLMFILLILTALLLFAEERSGAKAETLYLQATTACTNEGSVVGVIEASKFGQSGRYFSREIAAGRCKTFFKERPLGFRFIRVVREDLKWGDGEAMFVIEGQDRHGFTVFVWMRKVTAHRFGIDGSTSQAL